MWSSCPMSPHPMRSCDHHAQSYKRGMPWGFLLVNPPFWSKENPYKFWFVLLISATNASLLQRPLCQRDVTQYRLHSAATRTTVFVRYCWSLRRSSSWMISRSLTGFTSPSTCVTSSSSNAPTNIFHLEPTHGSKKAHFRLTDNMEQWITRTDVDRKAFPSPEKQEWRFGTCVCMCVDGIHDLFSHAHTPCPRELPSPDQLCQPRVGMPELCWQVSTVGIGNQISRRGPQHDLCRRSRYIGPLLGATGEVAHFRLVYRAEWEILRGGCRLCQHIEECWLARIRRYHTLKWFLVSSINGTYPTLGSPTIPHFRDVPNLPKRGVASSSSFFFGGIFLL